MAISRLVSAGVTTAIVVALAASSVYAADLGPPLRHRHHRHRVIVAEPLVPPGYAYGGYGNGAGPGWELNGVGPGYGYGFAPGYGYLGPGYANYGLDLGY